MVAKGHLREMIVKAKPIGHYHVYLHECLMLDAQVTEAYLECTEDNRDERLYYLLTQHPGRTLIFTNAISMVRRLAAVLKLLQLPVTAMHSSMQQRQRLKALDRFRKSDSAIMIATDVAARGLDIPVGFFGLPFNAADSLSKEEPSGYVDLNSD